MHYINSVIFGIRNIDSNDRLVLGMTLSDKCNNSAVVQV